MAVIRVFLAFGLLTFASAQQCDQAIADYHQCLRNTFNGPAQVQGQRPGFEEMKQKADQCFTNNNCEPPQAGQRGPPQQGGAQGFNGGHSAPTGGAGRGGSDSFGNGRGRGGNTQSGGSPPPFDSDNRIKCFRSISNQTRDYIVQCVRKVDPTFTPSEKGRGPPFSNDREGHGFPGGHGPGAPFGIRGPPPFAGNSQFLLKACKNNADAVAKVNTCLSDVFPRPDQNQQRKDFEAHCKAKAECESKLGSCKATMEQRRQTMCNCGKEAHSKRQEFAQSESACANVEQGGSRGPPQGFKEHDCSEKPQDPCQLGFDAVTQQGANGRRP